MTRLAADELCALRLRAQGLEPRLPRGAIVEVVKMVCGTNAQLSSAMELSLRARLKDLTVEDIEKSRVDNRALVRTWCMRGTLHLLASDDVDWLLSAISPAIIHAGWRWLEKRGGLESEHAREVLDEAYKTLKVNGPMTRRDLMAAVAQKHGPEVKSAAAGLALLNGMLGRVCFGPDRGTHPTYVALDEWLGRNVEVAEEPDYRKLVRRYLQGYGPAEPRDLAAWWGLGLAEAKAAWALLEEELLELDVEGQTVWMLASKSFASMDTSHSSHTVYLLPAFDTYLLGYRIRDFAVPVDYQSRVFHGGQIAPTILVDGCAAGTWRYERRSKEVRIKATPFTSFSSPVRDLIAEEAHDIGRFYGLTAALSFSEEG